MGTTFAPNMGKQFKRWTGSEVAQLKEKYDLTYQQIADEIGLGSYVPVWRWVNTDSSPSRMACKELDKLQRRLKKREAEQ